MLRPFRNVTPRRGRLASSQSLSGTRSLPTGSIANARGLAKDGTVCWELGFSPAREAEPVAQLLRGHARDTSAQARPGAGDAGAASFSGDLPRLCSHLRFTNTQPAEAAFLSQLGYSFCKTKRMQNKTKRPQGKETFL